MRLELPKPNDIEKKERTSRMPKTPAWRGCLTRCLSLNDSSYSAYKQGKKNVGALLQADRLLLDGKSKIYLLVTNVEGKVKKQNMTQQNKRLITIDHLFLSEYQALWLTGLLGPVPGRHPILIAGSTGHGIPAQESHRCPAVTRLD